MKIEKGFRALVAEAEVGLQSLSVAQLQQLMQSEGTLLVDLRDIRELKRDGKIPGAFHVPRGMLEFWIDPDSPYYHEEFNQAESLVLYCNKGWRSALAGRSLREMGVENVSHLQGGLENWQAQGGDLEYPGAD